ncbi:PepSY1/2 domain-containing protein [Calidifontibacillus oryziterrae]|uniref:PepSY1/2 domain-containing protein n=1 Tax=Calidifontibacillus oryziterrae TaxID=1191699 RepID=UPI000314C2F4|nr:YcdB/YcdC domain-containing protein [Calidifontibacillus oryziterrae]
MPIRKFSSAALISALVFSGTLPAAQGYAATQVSEVIGEVKVGGNEISANELMNVSQAVVEKGMDVEKEKLIEKVRSMFPNKFDFVADQDFRLNLHPYMPGNEEEVYNLHFFQDVGNGKYVNGNFEFIGKDLKLVSYHYSPEDVSSALYPPKVSKQEAQDIALNFLKNMVGTGNYRLADMNDMIFPSSINQPLTEPIQYQFLYERLENGIPVQDQTINVSVLGNGEVTQFYSNRSTGNKTYENIQGLLSKEEALKKVKDGLSVDLQYMIDRDYNKNTGNVVLTYALYPPFNGIHAKTGEFQIGNDFVSSLPAKQPFKMLADKPLKSGQSSMTKQQARELAERLLAPKQDNVKLMIEEVREIERDGIQVYSIEYMYRTGSSGHGTSMEINKQTGEIVRYNNISIDDFDFQPNEDKKPQISKDEALNKAIEYIKQYASQHAHQHAYPIESTLNSFHGVSNQYFFNFPRVVNGNIVNGDSINVSVSAETGELISLSTNYTKQDQWPDVSKAIPIEEAIKGIKDSIDLQLQYVNNGNDQYKVMYIVKMRERNSFFNALTGKWQKYSYATTGLQQTKNKISHPWAADELNFLMESNILKVDDSTTFNPNQTVTRGEALEIVIKSLSGYYHFPRIEGEDTKRNTFSNIKQDHPLFEIVERAAIQKVIDTSSATFNIEEKLTREELAFWYTRALGLQIVAEQDDLYKFDFSDTREMNNDYKGHIALMNSFDILSEDENKKFHPKDEVTIAELAVSTVRLAKLAAEMNIQIR